MFAYVAELPSLAESSVQGGFVEFVKALDAVYLDGKIDIRTYHYSRVLYGVSLGHADFGLPAAYNPKRVYASDPVRLTRLSFGRVSMVLYTRSESEITKADIGVEQLRVIAAPNIWHFPAKRVNSHLQAFSLLLASRVDAVIDAQEESDYVLKKFGLKGIRRQHYGDFEDVFMVSNDKYGQHVECVLYRAVEVLRKSGELHRLYRNIHLPYSDWQID